MLSKKIIFIAILGIAGIGILVSYFPFQILTQGFSRYGYGLLFLGTLLEGEAILLAGGIFAYFGHFNLFLVMLVASVAIILGDNIQYFIGRKLGKNYFETHNNFLFIKKKHFEKIRHKFNNHTHKILLASRFLFGARVATMVTAGAIKMPYKKFLKFNILSCLSWTVIIAFSGFAFGASFILLRKVLKYSALSITVLVILVILIYYKQSFFPARLENKCEQISKFFRKFKKYV